MKKIEQLFNKSRHSAPELSRIRRRFFVTSSGFVPAGITGWSRYRINYQRLWSSFHKVALRPTHHCWRHLTV